MSESISAIPITTATKNKITHWSDNLPTRVSRVTTNPSAFTRDMAFNNAIDILRNSTRPPLKIVVLWRDLEENAGVYRDTHIGIDGIDGIPLRKHLELLLASMSVSSPVGIDYVVENGLITIATKSSHRRRMKTRIYDITDLVNVQANYLYPGFMRPLGYYGIGYEARAGFTGIGPYPRAYMDSARGIAR